MSDAIIGIDLGTTNSEVAVVRDGQPVVLPPGGDPILPSVVGLSADGKLLVGQAARNQYVVAPERTIKSIKRKMGQDVTVDLGGQEYRPQEISAMILRTLRDRAAKSLGEPVRRALGPGVDEPFLVHELPHQFRDRHRRRGPAVHL